MSKTFGSLDFSGPVPLTFGMTPDELRAISADAPPEVRALMEERIARLEFAATLVHGLDLQGDNV